MHNTTSNQSAAGNAGCNPADPYNSLPALPPNKDVETKRILKKCVTARSELSALRQAASLIPNQTVLINSIPLREAQDSSAIENIVTTSDKLFRYASIDNKNADPATKETLRYRSALLEGFRSIKTQPITTNTAICICRAIKNYDIDIRKTPGTSLTNKNTGDVVYTPPVGETLLRNLLDNWERYIHEEVDIDPLIRMAVGHYQFEAIHPFIDGNGRTGRIINILYLIDKDLLDIPILYLSGHILKNRDEYYKKLRGVTFNQEWEEWIIYMLDAVEYTAKSTKDKIIEIKNLIDITSDYVKKNSRGVYSRELIESLFILPYTRVTDLVEKGLGHRNTVSRYMKELERIGVVIRLKEGREVLYINHKFLDLLAID